MSESTGMVLETWGDVWVEEHKEADFKKLKIMQHESCYWQQDAGAGQVVAHVNVQVTKCDRAQRQHLEEWCKG